MRREDQRKIEKYAAWRRFYNRWRRLVRTMACLVVFCTTYALILPAITMEKDPACGMEVHEHTEACYVIQEELRFLCEPEPGQVHGHEARCFDAQGNLLCPYTGEEGHIHGEICLEDGSLICGQDAVQLHTHSQECWEEDGTLICQKPELTCHSHSADCVTIHREEQLICELEEHTHTDSCYPAVPEQTQPMEQTHPTEQTWQTEAWTEATTADTRPQETTAPAETVLFRAETEHYAVSIVCEDPAVLPEGAQLRVTEFDPASELYNQHCVLAEMPLRWLLDLGFVLDGQELTMEGSFQVTVTGKQGQFLGETVVRFGDSGAETLPAEAVTENGQNAVTFFTDRLADIGGGTARPALMATAPVAAAAQVSLNFTSWNEHCPITFPQGNTYTCDVGSTVTIVLGDSGANYSQPQLSLSGCELVSASYSCSDAGCSHSGWCSSPSHTIVVRITAAEATVTASVGGAAWTGNQVTIGQPGGGQESEAVQENTALTAAAVQQERAANPAYPNHPQAVGTGNVEISRLRFYNICENGSSGISSLAGCVFEVIGSNGYRTTVTSGNTPEVDLPRDIPDGSYTITEISTPDGYMKDTNYTRSFTVRDGALASDNTIGTFINHDLHQLSTSKTGEVEDYNNRIYQILLSAENHMRLYEMDPVDVLFVVDQSNSMLFPSGLNTTGKSVRLTLGGSGNVQVMENLGLDKNEVYYIISDPAGTSTVWAVWYNGQSWMYQDASYYAKAWYNNGLGYQDPNERAVFPQNRSYTDQANAEASDERSNGGGLGYSLSGSGLGKYIDTFNGDVQTFEIYTASSEFNRLHYLEEALTNMICQLADINDENRVTLTEFTKTVDETNDCMGPLVLTPDNVEALLYEVRHINTSGGTRQDLALRHIYDEHLNDASENFSGDPKYTYTILVTDGAPVRSSGSNLNNLGSPNDAASTTADSIYAQIKGYAALVRNKSTLMTVGLGMDKVEGGKQVLQEIASSGNFNCALDDAAELVEQMQRLLFEAFQPKEIIHMTGQVEDEISDSFYPIAWTSAGSGAATGHQVLVQDSQRDWILLEEGDWITLEGQYTTAGASDGAGQLLCRENGTFYVMWKDIQLSNPHEDLNPVSIAWVPEGSGSTTGRTVLGTYGSKDWIQLRDRDYITKEGQYYPTNGDLSWWQGRSYGRYVNGNISWGSQANGSNRVLVDTARLFSSWEGTVYVKAKEDFIGGNAIATNKTAKITAVAAGENPISVGKELPSPTVNVHLLDMNQQQSQVTVYLGDLINGEGKTPLDSVKIFYDGTVITKLISDGGAVLNKTTAESADGLEEAVFYLRYAMGRDLTEADWESLMAGGSITIPYVYDNASSYGPVGEFVFRLEKTGIEGAQPDWSEHEAAAACQSGGQPLTENCMAPAETYALHISYNAYALGQNGRPETTVHNGTGSPGTEVGTGDTLATGLGTLDRANVHKVHVLSGAIELTKRLAQGLTAPEDRTFTFILHREEDGEDTSRDQIKTLTLSAGESVADGVIRFDNLRRGTYTVTEAPDEAYMPESILVLGSTNCFSTPVAGGRDLTAEFRMGWNKANQDVIGLAAQTDAYTSYIDPVNGVFAAAEITNKELTYTGEIPVNKVWDDGMDKHAADAVYVLLYLDGEPVRDAQGIGRLLRLDAASGWQGKFQVALKDKQDAVTRYAYSVREVSQVSGDSQYQDSWYPAALENDNSTVYYEKVLENGSIFGVNGRGYMVHYTPGENGAWTVTNTRAVELPKTGGTGLTSHYMFGGLVTIAAALLYVIQFGRKHRRGGKYIGK